ncbi:hypothetical protein [Asanoa siamensis]|uniref:YbaB/EbfC DNA-binding family protein n=1 Tax=Asanoa siamensis TaxID=926357 RepID=A0ABQ4D003_9ACTN|nr:hypothetical protein [Asanoa siamensis]GIF76848.1 hypothetical protein Asi02nite_63660 [Asanoa siamensis]
MRDAFGDALDRMARREELERLRADAATNRRTSVAAEVAEAVRRIVERHPDTMVTISVESAGDSTAFTVGWVNETVSISPGPVKDAAAQLADLIRRDHRLLGPDPD